MYGSVGNKKELEKAKVPFQETITGPQETQNHSSRHASSVNLWFLTIYVCMLSLSVRVCLYINVLCICKCIYKPSSWPENNLPKQVTRQGFHLEKVKRNDLILQIWSSFPVAAIFLNASTLTTTKKNKNKIDLNHKNATKHTGERKKNQKIQLCKPTAKLHIIITIEKAIK